MIKCFMIERSKDWEASHMWVRLDTGEEKTLHGFPHGAMRYEPWRSDTEEPEWRSSIEHKAMPAEERAKGHLIVRTPGGHWDVDAPATGKQSGWTRTGVAPNITAAPSIFHDPPNGWHGWLREGVLTSV